MGRSRACRSWSWLPRWTRSKQRRPRHETKRSHGASPWPCQTMSLTSTSCATTRARSWTTTQRSQRRPHQVQCVQERRVLQQGVPKAARGRAQGRLQGHEPGEQDMKESRCRGVVVTWCSSSSFTSFAQPSLSAQRALSALVLQPSRTPRAEKPRGHPSYPAFCHSFFLGGRRLSSIVREGVYSVMPTQ